MKHGGHDGAQRIADALRRATKQRRIGLIPFLTAGYPTKEGFAKMLTEIATVGDVVEIGVPFSDPMADGVTIQRSSESALEQGVHLQWILETLGSLRTSIETPLVLMSYLNPILSVGRERADDLCDLAAMAASLAEAGVSGLIVPDLPLEESANLRSALDDVGVGLIQLVSPVTPQERMTELCEASRGFVYAVTVTGITGGASGPSSEINEYLDSIRARSPWPVCAGFGIRSRDDVKNLEGHADGAIVGSALIECIDERRDPLKFLKEMRPEDP